MTFALLRAVKTEPHLEILDWENKKNSDRMQQFKEKFCSLHSDTSFQGPVDIGKDAYWWDFGSPDNYSANLLKLTEDTSEGNLMRLFFSISPDRNTQNNYHLIQDQYSILINCNIYSGKVENSVLLNVEAESIEVKNCTIINSCLDTVKAEDSLIYDVQDNLYTKLTNFDN